MTAEHSSSSHNKTVVRKRVTAEPRSCVKVEVAFLGSPSLTVLMVSVDVKQH